MTVEFSDGSQVWLKAFWGFTPENWACVGFTHEANRAKFLQRASDGDFVLIYGAGSKETAQIDRKQALGIFQIEARAVTDRNFIEQAAYKRKIDNGWADKWTFAVPAVRAWEIVRAGQVGIKYIATETYSHRVGRKLGSEGVLLSQNDIIRVASLPTRQRQVFGQPLPPLDKAAGRAGDFIFSPSRGIPPTFGRRSVNYEDAIGFLYLLKLEGDVSAFLSRQKYELGNRQIFKLGFSKSPNERCDEFNSHLPDSAVFRWKVHLISKGFANSTDAFDAENRLKDLIREHGESLGREFFLAAESEANSFFGQATASTQNTTLGGLVRR